LRAIERVGCGSPGSRQNAALRQGCGSTIFAEIIETTWAEELCLRSRRWMS
jgi:hypothetical protein